MNWNVPNSVAKHYDELARVKQHRDQLKTALEDLLAHYTQLVNCGDCGNWNPEDERQVKQARAALKECES